jgi:hypothetical protein
VSTGQEDERSVEDSCSVKRDLDGVKEGVFIYLCLKRPKTSLIRQDRPDRGLVHFFKH